MTQTPLNFKTLPTSEMLENSANFLNRMQQRRSVRDFSDRAIEPQIIENAIRTAGTAPSGANLQPWHFVVVSEPEIKQQIRRAAEQEEQAFYQTRAPDAWLEELKPLHTDAHKPFLETAPVLIAVFLQRHRIDEQGKKHKNYYMPESVGIATGMLLSALHLSGLATLTHTPSPMKFLQRILKRPSNEKPYMLIVVGYPAQQASVPDIQRKPYAQITTVFD